MRALHTRVPTVVLVLINLSLSPLSQPPLETRCQQKEEETCRFAGAWYMTLIFCDTPGDPSPPFASDMAAIGSVVHLQTRVHVNDTNERQANVHVDQMRDTSPVHRPRKIQHVCLSRNETK